MSSLVNALGFFTSSTPAAAATNDVRGKEEILKKRKDTIGSEANDLALRLARDYTKHKDAVVIEHAYHGHVTTTMELSPYKFDHGSSVSQPD
ncbi:hypothetical protein B9Z55_015305 [Caenorhabditis nigoni]|uniref:Uncharacterized protein n=1 Tax=Caenorhabditis nigoni TaxID=1611254 RepID=A0A2G5UA51_9PELO|nr:hypothetical protein B9Z55_015305 [Caenorhabditis nigoni]